MGYNNLNGKLYYFKRNTIASPQEFVSFDPATNMVVKLADCPASSIINLGCTTADGLGYYCLDAAGKLYYYSIPANTWTTISSSIKDQFGFSLSSVISTNSRIMGDFAIDGAGNLWIVISGDTDFGFYKLSAPLPTIPVTNITIQRYLPPTTLTPSGRGFGGIAFNISGQIFLSTNSGDNKLYRMETNLSLTYISTLSVDGLGNDLTSCNFPLALLPFSFQSFSAVLKSHNKVQLNWTSQHEINTRSYFIEHSTDGIKWETIANIMAVNQGVSADYSFKHETEQPGEHFYRIRESGLLDIKYSAVRMVESSGASVLSVWPNPAQDHITIHHGRAKNLSARVNIFDQSGIKLKEIVLDQQKNSIDIRTLSSGTYIINIQYTDGSRHIEKLVKL
jgi:hypothetical protein